MKKKLFVIIILVLIGLTGWWLFPIRKTAAPGGPVTQVIQTGSGGVRGFNKEGLDIFLAIPYAESPTGDLRFRPPLAHKPWSGSLDAYGPGAFCPQAYDKVVIDNPSEDLNNEDCLTLNIWAPSPAKAKRAVMVFIHGGGFVGGSSKELLYQGDVLARNGDVIVVTMNYRVGMFGFFDFSVIGGPEYAGSADLGIQDQLLALRWVKQNIAAFGGDPQNITVFGESAGGASALALLGVDQPQEYFKRMIVMSGSPLHTAENTRNIANLLKNQTGISWPVVWKVMPTSAVMYIQKKVLDAVGAPLSDLIFAPTYGSDYVVKRSPLEAVSAGNTRGIDLMLGNMADELSYWSFYDTPASHICKQTVQDNLFTGIDKSIEPKLQVLYDIYASDPQRKWREPGDILLAMGDDYAFRVQALQLASQQAPVSKTYYYRMDYPVNLPDQPCQNNRAPHGAELPFLFGKIDTPTGYDFIGKPRDAQDETQRQHLTDQFIRAWTNFAKTGDPNGGDLPQWPVFEAGSQPTMTFSASPQVVNGPFKAEYQAMADFMQGFSVFDGLK